VPVPLLVLLDRYLIFASRVLAKRNFKVNRHNKPQQHNLNSSEYR
jgi:hypothetical protein